MLGHGTRRIGSDLGVLLRIRGRLPGSCSDGLRRNDQRRARRVRRHMLLRHVRRNMGGVGVVLLVLVLLPARVLLKLLLGVEGLRRAMVEGVGVDGRLRRRAIHVAVVLLLAARLFVVWDGVARAHVVVIAHGDGATTRGQER